MMKDEVHCPVHLWKNKPSQSGFDQWKLVEAEGNNCHYHKSVVVG